MKVLRLKGESEGCLYLKSSIKELSSVMQNNTPEKLGCSFYRGHIFSTNEPYVAGIRLLCSDIEGNLSVRILEYNLVSRSLYYDTKLALFSNEEIIKSKIEKLIFGFDGLSYDVSQLYFDFVPGDLKSTGIESCYMLRDADEPGSVIVFASAGSKFHYKYNLSEANDLCLSTALSTDWQKDIYGLLRRFSLGEIDEGACKKRLASAGIKWVD